MSTLKLSINYWHAWGPNVQTQEDALAWATGERTWGDEAKPDVSFIPAMFRRRLSTHAKMVMAAAQPCLEHCSSDRTRSVFVSRWGEANIMVKLLKQIATRELVSPMDFSLSVHNTASGLFSIHHKNHEPTTAMAGGKDSFCYGMMEAAGILERNPNDPLLLVISDEPLPDMYAQYIDEHQYSYAIALLLSRDGAGVPLRCSCEGARDDTGDDLADPQAMLFLRWLLSGDTSLTLTNGLRTWRWERV